ncbi:MAG: NADH-quinone oxidoreductase subunit C [Acidimicrobiales bacterium]
MTATSSTPGVDHAGLAAATAAGVGDGARFAGLLGVPRGRGLGLRAVLARPGQIVTLGATLPPGITSYPALTPLVGAASWYERRLHDLHGIVPAGHPALDPLVGSPGEGEPLAPHAGGEGVFTIPYGPVRSGVFESVEYLVETPGEDIPHLRTRVDHKHRGIQARFGGLPLHDAVLLAERAEGVASVAHAVAFCQAVEGLSGARVPLRACLVRALHAELERAANHLDSAARHTEGAGQAVAHARITLHKERVLRLQAALCGSRFGRGVVTPGGVSGPPRLPAPEIVAAIDSLESGARADAGLLMATPSFLDRLRGTGVLTAEVAAAHGALGPVGRGSGATWDVRSDLPYGAYGTVLELDAPARSDGGDALARQHVRWEETWTALSLARRAAEALARQGDGAWRGEVSPATGEALGWAEAPQGEVLYLVELEEGRLVGAQPRSASFHNLALLPGAFGSDIFTDFVFIEASFGLSIAGVSG